MEYRYDNDLEFLQEMKSEDLNDLVYTLTHNRKDVKKTDELTSSELYKKYYPYHSKYWKDIAAEIQCINANSFATACRGGKGIEYKEVLTNACLKLGVKYDSYSNPASIENDLLLHILSLALTSLKQDELKDIFEVIGLKNSDFITVESLFCIFKSIFMIGGSNSYLLTIIIVNGILKNLLGRESSFIKQTKNITILTKSLSLAITDLWKKKGIYKTVYSVTIPAILQITLLRQKYLYSCKHPQIALN